MVTIFPLIFSFSMTLHYFESDCSVTPERERDTPTHILSLINRISPVSIAIFPPTSCPTSENKLVEFDQSINSNSIVITS